MDLPGFRPLKLIMSSPVSSVIKAVDPAGRVVAVKSTRVDHPKQFAGIETEANIMMNMDHPGILKVYDYFSIESSRYLIMEFCEEGSLERLLRLYGPLKEALAAYIFRQIVEAIAYCHERGVCHRDIKLSNILVGRFPVVKLSDFGMAAESATDKLLSTFCGSVMFCAPEILVQLSYDGMKADMWSLGVVLYYLVTGTNPWNTNNIAMAKARISQGLYHRLMDSSPELVDLMGKLLTMNPASRISAKEVLDHRWIKIESPCLDEYRHVVNIPVVKRKTSGIPFFGGSSSQNLSLLMTGSIPSLVATSPTFNIKRRGEERPKKTPSKPIIVKPKIDGSGTPVRH